MDKEYIREGLKFALDILDEMDEETCKQYYFNEYKFDREPPADEVENIICLALKCKLGLNENLNESTSKNLFVGTRLIENRFLKESDKPAVISIEDAQKWVDYDMIRYGKISNKTNALVKKAGFQIIKDDHGDYEVTAGHFE